MIKVNKNVKIGDQFKSMRVFIGGHYLNPYLTFGDYYLNDNNFL